MRGSAVSRLTDGFHHVPVDPENLDDIRSRMAVCDAVADDLGEFLESGSRDRRYTKSQSPNAKG